MTSASEFRSSTPPFPEMPKPLIMHHHRSPTLESAEKANAGGNRRPVIVLSDLRCNPVAAALSLRAKLRSRDPIFLVSEFTISDPDYGQERMAYRRLKVDVLKRLFGLESVAGDRQRNTNRQNDNTGVLSSLLSITNDSAAKPREYPELWKSLCRLADGADDIVGYLQKKPPAEVYLFNGRLASTYSISRYAISVGIDCQFYEYGSHRREYVLTPFPVHNFQKWGVAAFGEYKRLAESDANLEPWGRDYRDTKLSNQFTAAYEDGCSDEYDVSIFLSSSHEFASLDPELCGVNYRPELSFVQEVVASNGRQKKYAVRCHPNQAADKNWRLTLQPLEEYCSEADIEFYPPNSKVSSHELIRRSTCIAVDISSIGIDAVLLGKPIQIFGQPDYRFAYERLLERHGEDREAIANELSQVMAVRNTLFRSRIAFSGVMWRGFERLLTLLASLFRIAKACHKSSDVPSPKSTER